ncbi:MAG: T9SS type A sorting domain-containing protein [Bacteroidota bacterium]
MRRLLSIAFITLSSLNGLTQGVTTDTTNYLASDNWDDHQLWSLAINTGASASKSTYAGLHGDGIDISYSFPSQGDWLSMSIGLPDTFNTTNSIAFFIKSSTATNNLELKFVDGDGSTFRRIVPLSEYSSDWEHVVIYLSDTEYAWGGNTSYEEFSKFEIAVSGVGSGTVWIDEIGMGSDTLRSSFPSVLDPDSTLAGIGFAQRRDSAMNPEDPLVLEYLKLMQDVSSAWQTLMPSQEDNSAHTFNNVMTALAFIVKDERERVERILDFYANATDTNNSNIYRQNFYYQADGIVQARGFYQECNINTLMATATKDRWMGDMAWLLIACKNYENRYDSNRYDELVKVIKDLLLSFYIDSGQGGYIQHGWRDGDSHLHESNGHPEGNIDCYVALKLCGENYHAQKIKIWLEEQLANSPGLPLDLYTWRTLAFGGDYVHLLNIPEYNFNYRKVIEVNGEDVMGLFSYPNAEVNNFWNDGTGHISCAYQAFGDTARGYFYANQLDHLIIERIIGDDTTHAIPYTLNKSGGYDWVDLNKGFISSCAWYILAKSSYNPFLSENFTDTLLSVRSIIESKNLLEVFPNPFSENTTISFNVPETSYIKIEVFDLAGRKVNTLIEKDHSIGTNAITWNGEDYSNQKIHPGLYFISGSTRGYTETKPILYIE